LDTGVEIRGGDEVSLDSMFAPSQDPEFPRGAAVMTFIAMEQLGTEFERFAEYLFSRRPSVCIHVEPTSEFYDQAFGVW
jgi:hypothetical protein